MSTWGYKTQRPQQEVIQLLKMMLCLIIQSSCSKHLLASSQVLSPYSFILNTSNMTFMTLVLSGFELEKSSHESPLITHSGFQALVEDAHS